jgi:hypothetical protein
MDIGIRNGELDARTTSSIDNLFQKDIAEGLHFHATISNPKGRVDPRLPGLPDLDTFARTDKETKGRRLTTRLPGSALAVPSSSGNSPGCSQDPA